MTRRQEFSRRTKLDAWKRAKGHCEHCERKIFPGDGPEYDHRVPCEMGGEGTLENCQVLCKPCHQTKTGAEDAPRIAKARSVQARHVNATTTKRPMPGGRRGKWKRKIGGGWELREK